MSDFNRQAFEMAVLRHSPLKPDQIDAIFGIVSEHNRRETWQFLRLEPIKQFAVFSDMTRIQRLFPSATLERAK